jgi:hypothetical protein
LAGSRALAGDRGTRGAGGRRPSGLGICKGAWARGRHLPYCARRGAFGPSGPPRGGGAPWGAQGGGWVGLWWRPRGGGDFFFRVRVWLLQGTHCRVRTNWSTNRARPTRRPRKPRIAWPMAALPCWRWAGEMAAECRRPRAFGGLRLGRPCPAPDKARRSGIRPWPSSRRFTAGYAAAGYGPPGTQLPGTDRRVRSCRGTGVARCGV